MSKAEIGPPLSTILLADFNSLKGVIIDIREYPGGDDGIALTIINRFCDRKRVAFHRNTKIGPGQESLFTP